MFSFLQPKISFRKRKHQSLRERDDDDWDVEEEHIGQVQQQQQQLLISQFNEHPYFPPWEDGSWTVDPIK